MNPLRLIRAIRESHAAQFQGVDYQKAAFDALQGINEPITDDELQAVETSPETDCDCGFCATAKWKD